MLQTAKVPVEQFAAAELAAPNHKLRHVRWRSVLLAYYVDDKSGALHPPLHVIRSDRVLGGELRRVELCTRPRRCFLAGRSRWAVWVPFLGVREHRGTVYIETHLNPSAGCVIVLSAALTFKTALDGWTLGFIGADYAVIRGSEVHFMAVHPLHVGVYDVKRNREVPVYPIKNDPERRAFSGQLAKHLYQKWCQEHNARVILSSSRPISMAKW